MNDLMTALLGANWRTTAASYAQLAVLSIATYFYEGGQWPISPEGWATIGYGIFGVIKGHATKDAAVSNEPKPLAEAAKVGA